MSTVRPPEARLEGSHAAIARLRDRARWRFVQHSRSGLPSNAAARPSADACRVSIFDASPRRALQFHEREDFVNSRVRKSDA